MTDTLRKKIARLLTAWHENGRASFQRTTPSLDYDSYYPKRCAERRRWIALDQGSGGVFLLDPSAEEVYTIKAYGVPKRVVGTLDDLIDGFESANAVNQIYDPRYAAPQPQGADELTRKESRR